MIKFKAGARAGHTALVGFGLTAKNVEQLKLGNPIHVMGVELDLPFDVMIFFGETEQAIYAELRKHGLIDPEKTVLHDTSDKPKKRH